MKKKTLYFDLDGPILDVSFRYFFVHASICKTLGIKGKLDRRRYWQKKKRKDSLSDIIGTNQETVIDEYRREWLRRIEKKEALLLDRVFPFVYDVLSYLRKRYDMVVVTLRRRHKAVIEELDNFNLKKYFKDLLVVKNIKNDVVRLKADVIRRHCGYKPEAVFVGDTEVDIEAAKILRLKSVGVLSGIRNAEYIRTANPDYIIKDIRGLMNTEKGAII